jgi:hypothetical protein
MSYKNCGSISAENILTHINRDWIYSENVIRTIFQLMIISSPTYW